MSKGCWAWTTARRERRSHHDSKAGRPDALQSGDQLSSSLSTSSSSSLKCWLKSSSSTSFIPSILQLDNTWQYFTSTFKMQVRACLSLVYCIEVFDISLRSLTIALTAKDNDGHTLCRNRASQFPDIAPWMMNMTSDPNLLSLLNKTSSDDGNDSDPYQLEFKWTWHKLCHSENLWIPNYQSTSPPDLTYLLSSNWW